MIKFLVGAVKEFILLLNATGLLPTNEKEPRMKKKGLRASGGKQQPTKHGK